jgi:hypothetical protein
MFSDSLKSASLRFNPQYRRLALALLTDKAIAFVVPTTTGSRMAVTFSGLFGPVPELTLSRV